MRTRGARAISYEFTDDDVLPCLPQVMCTRCARATSYESTDDAGVVF